MTRPVARGFGSVLIEQALAHDMSAEAKIEFPPEGVRARVRTDRHGCEQGAPGLRPGAVKHAVLDGKRVLFVEDEFLVSLVVGEVLSEAGCIVIGPFARVSDALVAARTERVDIAVLDVNVAGEMVFPVAHALEERGTPFLFVTGYGQAALPRDKTDWEACTKPFQPRQLLERLARKMQAD